MRSRYLSCTAKDLLSSQVTVRQCLTVEPCVNKICQQRVGTTVPGPNPDDVQYNFGESESFAFFKNKDGTVRTVVVNFNRPHGTINSVVCFLQH